MNLGERIKQCRKYAGLTQEDLSKALGISLMTVRRWEWNQRTPDIKLIPSLAGLLLTSVPYLMGITETPDDDIEQIEALTNVNNAIAKKIQNPTPRKTTNMLIYNDGEQFVQLKNTPENRAIFKKTIYEMLENIVRNAEAEKTEEPREPTSEDTNVPRVDITQKDIGRDATVNFGTMAVTSAV